MPLSTGQILNNRYRVVRLLGEGGFGAVYRAWDVNLSIPCAVKESFGSASTDSTRQFAREANILASLRHPNLPKVTDYFSIPGQGQYLVMEYIDGENLEEKLANHGGGPLNEAQVVDWSTQILKALIYLHAQTPPIIHRDIKPANIRVTPQGQAILVDFGIAKFLDPSARTTVGARAITPGYSPFEQYGQASTDARSDIYALGATMYHLLTCQQPPESIQRMINDTLPPLQQLVPHLSPRVCWAIDRAMQSDPGMRWQTAADFLTALVDQPASEPVFVVPKTSVAGLSAHAVPLDARASVPGTLVVPELQPGIAPIGTPAAKKKSRVGCVVASVVGLFVLFACGFVILLGALSDNTSSGNQPTQFLAQATEPQLAAAAPVQATTAGGPSVIGPYATQVAPPVSDGETVKVGLLAPLSGQVPTFGVSVQEGAQLAVKEWNARGGVLGKPIELVIADSQCSADPAVNAATKLIDQDKVKYLVGEVCSSASIPVSEIANQKRVVQISPTSTNSFVTVGQDGKTKPFSFRACFIDSFQGKMMAKFAMSRGYKTAFIMYDPDNSYVSSLAAAFDQTFTEIGGQVVGKETYNASDTDFSASLNKVANSKAEVLFLPDYYPIANLVGAQAKDRGITAVMMGGDGWDSSDLDVKAVDGSFYANHYDPSDTRPILVDWLKVYGAEYKDASGQDKVPDTLAALSYDATNLLIAAIEKSGVDDPTKVAETLASLTWDGVTGPIHFDSAHNPIKSIVIIQVAKNQRAYFDTITP